MSSTTEVVRPRRSAPRPSTWFLSTALPSPALAAVKTPTEQANPFHAPPTSFRSPHSAIKGKHKLSPSPSPRHHDFDFAMASPRPPLLERTPNREPSSSDNSSSPMGDSPTPGFGSISGKARMPDVDDSPIRHVPGHSRSLAAAARRRDSGDDLFSPKVHRSPPPKALFTERGSSPTFSVPPPPIFQPIRSSQSQDCNPRAHRQSRIPRPSSSHPNRTRDKLNGLAAQKKTVSLGDIQVDKIDEPFGNAFLHARKARASMPVPHGGRSDRPHRRTPGEASIARSMGQKSGLSLTLLSPNAKKPELGSNSSISSISSASLTPPMADEPVFESNKHLFDNVKPNPEIFEVAVGIKQKFKGRDSTSSTEGDRPLVPPSVLRVGTLPKGPSSVKRARSLGHRPTELPAELPSDSLASKFDFVVNGVSSFGFHNDEKPMMPNTPVKRHAFAHTHPRSSGRMAMSHSQPALGTDSSSIFASSTNMPPPSTRKALPSMRKLGSEVPQLTVTTTSSPDSLMDAEESSPTIGHGSASKRPLGVGGRISLLRRISSSSAMEGSEDEITPTKGGGDASVLSASSLKTPTPSPSRPLPLSRSLNGSVVPRLSLPTLDEQSKAQRRLGHRQSHPVAPPSLPDDEDIFESRFTSLGPLGRGAFSTVLQVQERNGKGIFAVKKTRGVFDGVKDRLRHLEEVDILRHLSKNPNPHVLLFVDAWEQNRQLYIQTEACVGSLAAFLEVYGQTNERMDEGRVWKIARDISDGIRHMHDNGVIHFDLKPHNILIASDRSLKIADFGFATRWPRISPAEILAGSGLGGSIGDLKQEKLHREGDHAYMPPEMLRGVFVMAADIFSFGLVIFETAMNIYLPTGGPSWQALRENNFGFLDLSSLSPQLSDFITNCLNADPDLRPTIHQVLEHPVIQRTWLGGAALQVEDPSWLASILSGSPTSPSSHTASETPLAGLDGEGDVIMGDA